MSIKGLYLENKTPSEQFKIKLFSNIAFGYLHVLDICAKKYLVNYKPEKRPVIYAMWHGYQWGLGLFPLKDRERLNILISLSNDGEMIARVCHLMGFSLVRGSHQREGEKALRDIIEETKQGNNIAFMVDGPKGPKQKVKKGIIRIAKMAHVPIIPIVPYTDTKFSFNSWDNYQVPNNFFSRVSMIFGEPIEVPANIKEEQEKEYISKLENYMFELEKDIIIEHKHFWGK